MLKHPFSDREIPLVLDDAAEIEFGTGAVKVTPAHDPTDFEIGKRHNLAFINILNDDNTMNENSGPFTVSYLIEGKSSDLYVFLVGTSAIRSKN